MNILFSILSGIILALAYNYNFLWVFSFVALIPLLYVIYNTRNVRKVYFCSHLAGFIFLGLSFFWLFDTYPLVWLQTENNILNFGSIFVIWFSASFILSSLIGLFGVILNKLKTNKIYDIFLISSLWILFESLRGWFLFFLYYSKEALFGSHYTFGFLGYNLSNSSYLLKLAGIGGVYLLSFTVVLINAILFFIFLSFIKEGNFLFFCKKIKNSLIKPINFRISIFIFVIVFSCIFLNSNITKIKSSKTLNIAILQTKFLNWNDKNNQLSKLDKKEIYKKILLNIKDNEPEVDVILFPESTDFTFDLIKTKQDKNFYQNLWPQKEILIIDSAFVRDWYGDAKSKMYYYNTQSQKYDIYEKQLLVPTGESMPYLAKILLRTFGLSDGSNYFEKYKSYTKSDQKVIGLGELNNSKIGILFCSEIFSSSLYQDLIFQKAEIIGLSASYSTFRGSFLLLSQLEKIAKIRAVENNRYFIQSSNFGYSLVIDNRGKILAKTKEIGNGYLSHQVKLIDRNNLYTYLGDWVLWASFFFLCFSFLKYMSYNKSNIKITLN